MLEDTSSPQGNDAPSLRGEALQQFKAQAISLLDNTRTLIRKDTVLNRVAFAAFVKIKIALRLAESLSEPQLATLVYNAFDTQIQEVYREHEHMRARLQAHLHIDPAESAEEINDKLHDFVTPRAIECKMNLSQLLMHHLSTTSDHAMLVPEVNAMDLLLSRLGNGNRQLGYARYDAVIDALMPLLTAQIGKVSEDDDAASAFRILVGGNIAKATLPGDYLATIGQGAERCKLALIDRLQQAGNWVEHDAFFNAVEEQTASELKRVQSPSWGKQA